MKEKNKKNGVVKNSVGEVQKDTNAIEEETKEEIAKVTEDETHKEIGKEKDGEILKSDEEEEEEIASFKAVKKVNDT